MPNSMSGQPLLMDTATASWAANALPGTQALNVSKILWVNPTTAAHTFSIVDIAGTILLSAICSTGNAGGVIAFDFPKSLQLSKANGWRLSQISSGTLEIYF